jgi:membrane fusion protein, multidrug efflux system
LLVAVVPLSDVYVSANFKETQLGKIRIGQSVDLHVDAYPDQKVSGIVDSISPASGSRFSILPAENATGNFTKIVQRVSVKIRLADKLPDGIRLTPGMSVEASVDTRTAPAARR